MRLFYFIFVFVAVCVAELNLEATDGENVTISFKTTELDRASRVRVTFKGEYEDKARVIVQFCANGERCPVVETLGVLLRVEERTLTLQHVSSNNSGFYEAQVFIGKVVSQIKAVLVVNKPAFSFTKAPLHSSTIKPPKSSEHQWLYTFFQSSWGWSCFYSGGKNAGGQVLGPCFLEHDPATDFKEARETPAVSRPNISRKIIGKSCYDCAVSFNHCRENTEDLLDT